MSSRPISRKSATYTSRRARVLPPRLDFAQPIDPGGDVAILPRLGLQREVYRQRSGDLAFRFKQVAEFIEQFVEIPRARRRRLGGALEAFDRLGGHLALAEDAAKKGRGRKSHG